MSIRAAQDRYRARCRWRCGLKLHAATGVISGTPASSGASTFTAQVSDGENPPVTASAAFSLVTGGPAEAISTTPGAGGPVGSTTVTDTATLTGGFNPTGTITFTLYSQPDCTNPIATSPQGVNGDGNYTSPAVALPEETGTFFWVATYSGDVNNLPSGSACDADPVEIDTP
jgi:hypothetical protein